MPTDFATLSDREAAVFAAAAEVTETHLRTAVDIVQKVMKNDSRFTDGALLGAVVQALAANFTGLLVARKTDDSGFQSASLPHA